MMRHDGIVLPITALPQCKRESGGYDRKGMEAKSRRPLRLTFKDALSAGAESSCSTFNLDGRPPKNVMHTNKVKRLCDRGILA